MNPSEKIGLVAFAFFFIVLAVSYLLPAWTFDVIIALALVTSAFALFATYLQHREEAR